EVGPQNCTVMFAPGSAVPETAGWSCASDEPSAGPVISVSATTVIDTAFEAAEMLLAASVCSAVMLYKPGPAGSDTRHDQSPVPATVVTQSGLPVYVTATLAPVSPVPSMRWSVRVVL